jgi:hypothetical protein
MIVDETFELIRKVNYFNFLQDLQTAMGREKFEIVSNLSEVQRSSYAVKLCVKTAYSHDQKKFNEEIKYGASQQMVRA